MVLYLMARDSALAHPAAQTMKAELVDRSSTEAAGVG